MIATTLSECQVDVGAAGGVGELAAVLAHHGVALFTRIHDEAHLLQLAARLGRLMPHRDSNASAVTVLTDRGAPRPGAGLAGFTRHALAPHTDCSDRPIPPLVVTMSCARTAGRGGDFVLVDGQAVHDELAATAPDALADLSTRRGAYFGGAAGVVGNVFEVGAGGLVGMRLRRDELARFAPQTRRRLAVLAEVIDRHTITIPAATGCGYVVNNRRWLHGRTAFTGRRVMHRVLVDPHPAWRIPAGFRPNATEIA
ncbi:TauD/TfdA family dioxygenase [Amycolatopsis sp. FBCC-B4732]|uniref:TauD/TfdA family dioxygenase n=1 Tax=Amycolatopsis sp. FBCC-B4732 TaxID=3079339 RepID=UPI001FF47E66|nr:TauD/TfdA family dioxygenase [Amycolatopsis sp. FBCC-B4732]UOX88381.1 TauD/TfdA family dioxygenase [Amycolatopsis sp. FBCC-B4732]